MVSNDDVPDSRPIKRQRKFYLEGNPPEAEIGRLLGSVSRSDPDLFMALKEYSENSGQTMTETVIMLIKKQLLFQRIEMEKISLPQVLIAWDVLRDMLHFAMKIYTSSLATFFREENVALRQVVEEHVKELQKNGNQKTPSPLGSEFANKMMDLMMPMIEQFVYQAFKPMGIKPPPVKVPVVLKLDEGEGKEDVKPKG
jgi:hypothetical protein